MSIHVPIAAPGRDPGGGQRERGGTAHDDGVVPGFATEGQYRVTSGLYGQPKVAGMSFGYSRSTGKGQSVPGWGTHRGLPD